MGERGNLPHLYYILCKPELLGEEFKTVACYATGALLLIELKRGKERTNTSNYRMQLGATTSCTKRMTEAAKGIGHRDIKGATKDCFLFESWRSSKKLSEAAMGARIEIISTVKTNKKDSARVPLRIQKSVGLEVVISC